MSDDEDRAASHEDEGREDVQTAPAPVNIGADRVAFVEQKKRLRTIDCTTTGEIEDPISPVHWNVGCGFQRVYPFPFNMLRVISMYELGHTQDQERR